MRVGNTVIIWGHPPALRACNQGEVGIVAGGKACQSTAQSPVGTPREQPVARPALSS
jgi:hypothetical protein